MPRLLFSSQDDFSGDSPASFKDEYVNGSSCAPHAIERMLFIFYCKRAFFIPPRNANFVGIFGLRDRRHSGFSRMQSSNVVYISVTDRPVNLSDNLLSQRRRKLL